MTSRLARHHYTSPPEINFAEDGLHVVLNCDRDFIQWLADHLPHDDGATGELVALAEFLAHLSAKRLAALDVPMGSRVTAPWRSL